MTRKRGQGDIQFDLMSLIREEFNFSIRTFFAPVVAIAQAFGKQFHEVEKSK